LGIVPQGSLQKQVKPIPNSLRGSLRAIMFEIQGRTGSITPENLLIASGQKDQPADSRLDLIHWSRLLDVEVDIQLKANAWVLKETLGRLAQDYTWPQEREKTGSHPSILDGQVQAQNNNVTFVFEQTEMENEFKKAPQGQSGLVLAGSPKVLGTGSTRFVFEFPREMEDYAVVDVKVSGHKTCNPPDKPNYARDWRIQFEVDRKDFNDVGDLGPIPLG
jgi:hypothetical protein